MKKIFLATMMIFMGGWAQAYEMGVTGGMQTMDVEDSTNTVEFNNKSGFYAGVLGFIDTGDGGYFRTGALLGQRGFSYDVSSSVTDVYKITYLDVPLNYLFMFNEYAGIYGGLKLSLAVSDSCDVEGGSGICNLDNVEGMAYAASVGGHFRFVPEFGIEVEYDLGLSDVAKDVEWKSSLTVGAFYLF
ncbi:MAG: outer membrane beta-barrel protein [Bdellovibrionales bacterium]|nr:outer membrane beta-barrel protein [Bdellovibrionales bacterium]